ncbi:hypothetical protein [Yoonia sp. BS5-3]|uniref:Uncharacterized protein n=1 Tax=Yoonia phaeophyticola TaxID=3137369 RepID=A0ABZ2V0Z4_9RHOB
MKQIKQWLSRHNRKRLDRRNRAMFAQLTADGVVYLNPIDLKGIDLAIVGPASTVIEELISYPIGPETWVCRMNNGVRQADENPKVFGDRTDIWIHNLKMKGTRSVQNISAATLASHRVRYVVYPHAASPEHIAPKLLQLRKATHDTKGVVPPIDFYQTLVADLGGHTPTAGCVMIMLALQASLKSLSIYGFTFFQTSYTRGYNDTVKDGQAAMNWAMATGMHNPEAEAKLVAQRITKHRKSNGFPIHLGDGVKTALNSHSNDILED